MKMDILYTHPHGFVPPPILEVCATAGLEVIETDLCRLMNFYGSDKASRHGYTRLYHCMLSDFRKYPVTLFELGVGTTSTDFRANMGARGVPGASLRAWRDYFPKARILGADIDSGVLFRDHRIETYHVDATNVTSTEEMLTNALSKGERISIVVDDGPHLLSASLILLMTIYPYLERGGYHIIEDILDHPNAIKSYAEFFEAALETIKMEWAAIVRVPHHLQPFDNCIAIFKKAF